MKGWWLRLEKSRHKFVWTGGQAKTFLAVYGRFFWRRGTVLFLWFNRFKKLVSYYLYRQRGRFSQPLAHFTLTLFIFLGVYFSPKLEAVFSGSDSFAAGSYLASPVGALEEGDLYTPQTVSSPLRGEIVSYVVRQGETVSSIAKKFGVSMDTIIWANNINAAKKIKAGQRLKIPPVTGIVHKVRRGETVYSVAKKYQVNPQEIVDFPFNTFVNDENFSLAVGQSLIVPNGVMPQARPSQSTYYASRVPIQSGVKGTGSFAWPTSGVISQGYHWYHKALDIANRSAPLVKAADGGQVTMVIRSRFGYGRHVVVDHGNGYKTLYAHMSKIYVKAGDKVSRGSSLGQMGSTGRSTGTHLHFEIIKNGVKLNPIRFFK